MAIDRDKERARRRRYQKERADRLRAAHICVKCGMREVRKGGPVRCLPCRLRTVAAAGKRRTTQQVPCVRCRVNGTSPTARTGQCADCQRCAMRLRRHMAAHLASGRRLTAPVALNATEEAITHLLAQGYAEHVIARELGCKVETVRAGLRRVCGTFGDPQRGRALLALSYLRGEWVRIDRRRLPYAEKRKAA